MDIDFGLDRSIVEAKERWLEWIDQIPYLQFPPDWQVKLIPPFNCAMVRMLIQKAGSTSDERVSVYLDVYNKLGISPGPYWEVYPLEGDTYRCLMAETDKLLNAIGRALEELK